MLIRPSACLSAYLCVCLNLWRYVHPRTSPFSGILDPAFKHLGPFSEEPAVERPPVYKTETQK